MDVSVIIVNYKTVQLVLDCLESLYVQTLGLALEVIVVDNASEDEFQEKIQSRFPEVLCLPLKENVGFGRANNEGLKIAKGRNILFFYSDTLLLNNAVKFLSNYLDAHPQVGVCGGNLYDEMMRPAHSYMMRLPGIGWELNGLLHGIPDRLRWGRNGQFNHVGEPLNVGYITGADMMVCRSVLDKVGGFSPAFFMYYEETELTFRIKKAGYKVVSVPNAKIQHLEGRSFKKGTEINRKKIEYLQNGRCLYYKLCHKRWSRCVALLIYTLSLYLNIIVYTLLCNSYRAQYFKVNREILKNSLGRYF